MGLTDVFSAMQAAVDIVGQSLHPTSKVAATLFREDFSVSRTNYWPEPILRAFGTEAEVGNSSGSVHSETASILDAPFATEGSILCILDPPCPNCAKNSAEAGVTKICIDHKGFDKDYYTRRGEHFQNLSMRIFEQAGISVYKLWRQDRRLEAIFESPPGYAPPEDSPIYKEPVEAAGEAAFSQVLTDAFRIHHNRKFAVVLAAGTDGRIVSLTARGHAVTGFTMQNPEDIQTVEKKEDKYSLFQEPVNRLLMYMARHGLKPLENYFFSSQIPTSREQVNLVGAGIRRIIIGDLTKSRDGDAIRAMQQLSGAGIINYT